MARVSDVRESSRQDKERVARQKRESSRPAGIEKGLGVTFYKQGIDGPMSTKKSTPAASAKRKAIQGDKKPAKRVLERGFSPRDSANVKATPVDSGPRRGGAKLGVVKGQEQRFRPAPPTSGPRRGGAKPGTPAKPDTSNYVFSPMMGKMVPKGQPLTPTKKPSSLSEIMKRNWEKYRPKTGAGR